MKTLKKTRLFLPAALGVALLAAVPAARAERLVLLTTTNSLVTVDSNRPGTALELLSINGLPTGETLLGFDVRPRDGSLVAVSSASRLYTVRVDGGGTSATATAIGTAPFTPALQGTLFSFNFNPTVDRIRLVSEARQDLRLNPDTGGVAFTDGNEAYASTDPNAALSPAVTGVSYTSSGPNASVTQLYVIESAAGVLALQNPPNNGTLTTVGSLGVGANVRARGFEISNATERAYANFVVNNVPTLYSVNLGTGASTSLGALPTSFTAAGATAPTAIAGYNSLTVPFQNVVRQHSADGFVTKSQSVATNFTVGNALNSGAGSGSALRVVIRGFGPSLGSGGVGDPQLRVYRLVPANGTTPGGAVQIALSKDYTRNADGGAAVTATGYAPGSAVESAVVLTLEPGTYQARVASQKGTTQGFARVEVLELD